MTTVIEAPILLAFRVEIDDMRCICFAATPAKARWKAVKAYWEAGYGRQGDWPRPHAVRAPSYDDRRPSYDSPGRCYTEAYL